MPLASELRSPEYVSVGEPKGSVALIEGVEGGVMHIDILLDGESSGAPVDGNAKVEDVECSDSAIAEVDSSAVSPVGGLNRVRFIPLQSIEDPGVNVPVLSSRLR